MVGVLINLELFCEVGEFLVILIELKFLVCIVVWINFDFELKSLGMKMGGGFK